jgi:hypothetical protein
MSLLGIFGGDDKKKRPPVRQVPYIVVDDGQQNSPQSTSKPWQQSLQQAKQTRSNFWNNMSGLSWNRGKSKAAEVRKRRRRPY